MMHHIFKSIDELFIYKNQLDVGRKDPISLKKLLKGYARCITKKTDLSWETHVFPRVLTLPQAWINKIFCYLDSITNKLSTFSKRK